MDRRFERDRQPEWQAQLESLPHEINLGSGGYKLIPLPDDKKERRSALQEMESMIAELGGVSVKTEVNPGTNDRDPDHWSGIREIVEAFAIQQKGDEDLQTNLAMGRHHLSQMMAIENAYPAAKREYDNFDQALFFRMLAKETRCILLKPDLDLASPEAYRNSVVSLFSALNRRGLLTGDRTAGSRERTRPAFVIPVQEGLVAHFTHALQYEPRLRYVKI